MSGVAKAAARTNETVQMTGMTRDREERFRAMFEGAAIGIGTCNLDGHIMESNAALAKMLGYSREELSGIHARELRPVDFQPDETRGTRDSFKQETRYRRKDGSDLWGQLTVSVVHDAGGKSIFLIAMLEDATEARRAAEKSRAAEKMEVIGRLAGGIAHDFNNLLTGILLYCDLLSAGIERGSRLLQHVEEIRLAGEQGAALTQQLLAIARKQAPQPRPILLNDVVSSTENLLRRLIGEQIDLVTVLATNLRTVLADQAQLRQVLLNLVLNARDAMPHGGRITVSTQASNRLSGSQAAVSLLVEDTGCGMDEGIRARLFEPFFTPSSRDTAPVLDWPRCSASCRRPGARSR
jgi:two-component system, cell cycle sensor histidine kinase and response regulator CckA